MRRAADAAGPLPVSPADVTAAAVTLEGLVVRTPSSVSQTLSGIAGCEVVLKFENLQFTSSFKERGARNVLEHLTADERRRGVVAASAGNHAQGLAHHAALLGVPAVIVMPEGTPYTKVDRTEVLGAQVVLAGADYDQATATAAELARREGARLVPAFDDPLVIAGQGTVGLELLADAGPVDAIVVPVGGGGLVSGIALAAAGVAPGTEVIGVQAEGYAGMSAALGRAGPPPGGPTIADGIAVREPGLLTRRIVEALGVDLLVVSEDATESAVAVLLEIEKTVVEGAGAVGLAAVLEHRERFAGRRVGIVLSGGNIDLRVLSSVILRALARSGRLHRLSIDIPDRPGLLAEVAGVVADAGGNIIDVEHRRDLPGLALRRTILDLSMETRNEAMARSVVDELERRGYQVTRAGPSGQPA